MWPWQLPAAFNKVLDAVKGVERNLRDLIQKENRKMSAALDRITQEVAQSREATTSILALVSGLADQIRELKEDPAALEALADELDTQQAEIVAAVEANTPQAPEEPQPEE